MADFGRRISRGRVLSRRRVLEPARSGVRSVGGARRHDQRGRARCLFDPAPVVTERLAALLPFALRTSTPTHAEGLTHTIAQVRGVPEGSVLPGAGSSDLIFTAFRHWIDAGRRVLILDPMYGEYAHLLERVIGADVHRLRLERARDYDVDASRLLEQVRRGCDWVVIINPNSPTGRHLRRERLIEAIEAADASTRFWIDETYVDYVDPAQSLESYAAESRQVVVCKSMSKAYALSGTRVAYLAEPRRFSPSCCRFVHPGQEACWRRSLPAPRFARATTTARGGGRPPHFESSWRLVWSGSVG